MDRFGLKMTELGELRTFKSLFTILLQGKLAGMIVTKYGEKVSFLIALALGLWGLDQTYSYIFCLCHSSAVTFSFFFTFFICFIP
jgi:hypothetical protein